MHELSKANLMPRLPEGADENGEGGFTIPIWNRHKTFTYVGKWKLRIGALRDGKRLVDLWCMTDDTSDIGLLPLEPITTLAELIDWYERLSGKKWPEGKGKP